MPEYTSAPDVEKIAERLIADHHRHLLNHTNADGETETVETSTSAIEDAAASLA